VCAHEFCVCTQDSRRVCAILRDMSCEDVVCVLYTRHVSSRQPVCTHESLSRVCVHTTHVVCVLYTGTCPVKANCVYARVTESCAHTSFVCAHKTHVVCVLYTETCRVYTSCAVLYIRQSLMTANPVYTRVTESYVYWVLCVEICLLSDSYVQLGLSDGGACVWTRIMCNHLCTCETCVRT
jgi:hypothetical protein